MNAFQILIWKRFYPWIETNHSEDSQNPQETHSKFANLQKTLTAEQFEHVLKAKAVQEYFSSSTNTKMYLEMIMESYLVSG